MKKYKKRIIVEVALLLTGVLIACFTVNVLGRYVSIRKSEGVASASNVYFSSNFLSTYTNTSEYPETLDTKHNTTSWDGNNPYSFDVNIRNYANRLQFNDSDITIDYDIYFQLDHDTENYTYNVNYGLDQEKNQSISWSGTTNQDPDNISIANEGSGDIIKISNQSIAGGAAHSNSVRVTVTKTDQLGDISGSDQRTTDGIKMWIKPTGPSYIIDSNQFYLGGNLVAVSSLTGFTCEGTFSLLTGNDEDTVEFQDMLKKQSGFVYVIRTAGENNTNTHPITLTFDNTMVTLSDFDYSNLGLTKTTPEGDLTTLTISAKTDSVIQITFFKTAEFDSKIESKNFSTLVTTAITN